jgi:hypothetical protein
VNIQDVAHASFSASVLSFPSLLHFSILYFNIYFNNMSNKKLGLQSPHIRRANLIIPPTFNNFNEICYCLNEFSMIPTSIIHDSNENVEKSLDK